MMNFLGGKFGRPKRDGTKPLFLSQPFISASLVNGSFKKISALPKYVDLNEWLAVNTFDFVNYINLFYDATSEFCTHISCPVMHAGPNCEYFWVDNQKRNVKVSAPQYIDYVISWVQRLINDEGVFPTKADNEFPKDFHMTIRQIFKQLFRIFAHIYHVHYEKILHLSSEAHFNTLFAHFVCFAREFELLDKKDLTPMAELIAYLDEIKRL